jgi:hypothetical protein
VSGAENGSGAADVAGRNTMHDGSNGKLQVFEFDDWVYVGGAHIL